MSITSGITRDPNGRVRAVRGQPKAGAFANDPERRMDGAGLTLEKRDDQPERWPAEPNADQARRAGAEALRRSILYPESSNDFERLQTRIAQTLAEQESCHQAFLNGQAHHDDAAYQALWDGDAEMTSFAAVTARLDELTEHRKLIVAGRGNPELIFGRGTGRSVEDQTAALTITDEHIELLTAAIECGGRNLTRNQARVCRSRAQENEEAIPF
jgi:hypothetical protein